MWAEPEEAVTEGEDEAGRGWRTVGAGAEGPKHRARYDWGGETEEPGLT